MLMDKIAFLDRDGVINVNIGKNRYVSDWNEFVFLPGVFEGIKKLNDADYKVIIVTNQSGIAQKLMTVKQLERIHENMVKCVSLTGGHIDQVYYCPHARDAGCNCRKPAVGMFLSAEKIYQIDKRKSFMIGDSMSDMQAAENYGIQGILISSASDFRKCIDSILDISVKSFC